MANNMEDEYTKALEDKIKELEQKIIQKDELIWHFDNIIQFRLQCMYADIFSVYKSRREYVSLDYLYKLWKDIYDDYIKYNRPSIRYSGNKYGYTEVLWKNKVTPRTYLFTKMESMKAEAKLIEQELKKNG